MSDSKKKNWIQGAVKKPGALHETLHVAEGEKIPQKKLQKAAHSSNDKTARRARLAITLSHLREKGHPEK